ncbi:hypothetical protein ACHQM5_006178 [Ranunculus cassubicifolius]
MESPIEVPKKPHAIFLPFPFQSHINAMLKLAKLLYFKGFRVTFVNTEFNHQKIVQSRGPESVEDLPDFRFKTIPDGLPSCDISASQDIWTLAYSVQTNFAGPFGSLLNQVNEEAVLSDSPPVTCIISDACMTAQLVVVAEELGIPLGLIWTMSAAFLMGNLHCGLLIEQELIPPKDKNDLPSGYLEMPIDVIPGLRDIRLKDLPSFFWEDAEPMKNFLICQLQGISKASAIIINTVDTLESEVLEEMKPLLPPIYTIGPLQLLVQEVSNNQLNSMGSNLWKEDEESIKWLDSKKPNSVVYVNFGSLMVLTIEQFIEFAWGLADSNYPFLWVIRPDLVSGEKSILPPEFVKETADRGMISGWCPQEQVLCHASTAAFLTHSGWNSTLDTICGGVPIISWPGFMDQPMNCRFSCFHWGIGMEMNKNVTRDQVKALATELMEGEKGKDMKRKAITYKNIAEESTKPGGTSYVNLDRIVEVLTATSLD